MASNYSSLTKDGRAIQNINSWAKSVAGSHGGIAPVNSSLTRDGRTIQDIESWQNDHPLKTPATLINSDIAPVGDKITDRMTAGAPTYFQKGSDSVAKKILGSSVDVLENIGTGGLGVVENFLDTSAFAAPLVQYGQFLQDGMYSLEQLEEQEKEREEVKKANAEFIQQDLINEEKIAKAIITNPLNNGLGIDAESDSIFGEKMDANFQSLGALIARMGLGKLGINGDMLMGMTSFGAEAENAFNNGATYEDAGVSGAFSAAGEILTEKLFGGIKVGDKALDDLVSAKIARGISNKFLRTATKFGLDVAGEGIEEIASGLVGALGQKLSYADDKEIKELFTKEDAWDSFVGGVLMGGTVDGIKVGSTLAKKGDYASGLSDNERKVVDKVYKDQINDKMTGSQKQKVWDSVIHDMETGAISVETIEEVLGGKAYEQYKGSRDDKVYKEIVEEYNSLNDAESLTAEQMSRLNEIAPKAKTISEMQKKHLEKLRNQVKNSVKGDKLAESYRERGRRGEAFQADVSQYDEKQRAIVQKAVDSGVLNNTNRSHQFVDLVAKISADKGVDFDFTNNDKIKESGFAIEGKSVNGYVTESGVTINMQTAKALNTVVGHEITHVLEGTELYDTLQKAVFNYAESKGELSSRWNDIKRLYKDADNTKINQELAADLVGDYLFTDSDFINNLYSGDRNIFEKIYDEVKYLCKVVTAGSKEARELEKVKKMFADAYRQDAKKTAEDGVKYNLTNNPSNPNFTSDEWSIVNHKKHSEFDNPKYDLDETNKWLYSNKNGKSVFAVYSKNDPDDPTVLHGSRGKNADRDYARLMKYMEGRTSRGKQDGATFDRWAGDVERISEYRSNGVHSSGEGISTTGDVPLHSEEQRRDGRGDYGDGSEDLQAEGLTENDAGAADVPVAPVTFSNDYQTIRNYMKEDSDIAPSRYSLSDNIAPTKQYGTYNVTSDEVLYKPRTAEEILREPVTEPAEAMTPAEKAQKHFSDEVSLDKMPEEFKKKHGGKWKAIKQATDRAHDLVVHGADGVKPLKEIFDAVSKDGAVEEFDLYMHHLLNTDRMSLSQRFGLDDKPVFGKDVTAEMSRQEAAKLEKAHPEFKEAADAVYAYNNLLRDILVECGAISQQTADEWAKRYPHYVPIKRKGFEDSDITDLLSFVIENMDQTPNADSMDSFFEKVSDTAPLKAATGGEKAINPLLETMTERAFQTYWTVAMRASGSGDIAPVAKRGEPAFGNAEELNAYIQENYNFNKLSQTDQHAVQMVSRREEYKAIKADLEARIAEEGDKAKETGDLTEFNKLVRNLDEINELLRDLSGFKLPPPNKKPLKDLSYLDPTRRKNTDIAPLPQSTLETPVNEVQNELPERVTFVDEENAFIDVPDADSLDADKVLNKGRNLWNMFQEYFLDNGMVFERLAKDTKDRGLEADWNFIRKAPAIAQNLIGRGNPDKGIKALKDIFTSVEELGLTKAEKETVLKDFSAYLGHKRNMDGMTMRLRYGVAANIPFMGRDVTAAESSKEIKRLEKAHPEFKALAEDVYAYNNHQFDLMVEHGMLSQEDADLIKEIYPHYVPMNRFNGKNESLFQTMAKSTLYIQRAIALNDFGIHLKNTLNSVVGEEAVNVDTLIDEMDNGASLFELDKHGGSYTFRVYENGQTVTFKISDEMYEALKPTSALLSFSMPGLSHVSNLRRNLITAYSPWFTAKNAIRDVQEIIVNSQHARETYATIPTAIREMVHKGKWYQEYIQNGGEPDTFFDTDKETFDIGKGAQGFAENKTPLKYILKANNFVEMVPRFAEYIASREAGRDVRTSMLDASRVTTNFAAGGKATKLLDRNGATFLNASVQGALQHARNIHEANANGFKGWASLVARYASLGIPAAILNGMIWDDDEEYQQLPDYITENYYIVWKYGDGKFVRLPKGRTAAVVQNAVDQVAKESSGNGEADWKKFWKLTAENLAPNNPLADNVFAPIVQVAQNKTWYEEDLVPKRLQDLPITEQYDEKTDSFSIWLSNKLVQMGVDEENVLSPKQINYLADQYSGVVGDTVLPFMTPKAESPNDSLIGKIGAPVRDVFTTDSVLNNRVTGDFYETMEAVEAQAASADATEEDKFKRGYLISYNAKVGKLMQEQREIQTSDLPDSEKYAKNRELKEKINALQQEALDTYQNAKVKGKYAEVGDRRYNCSYDSENREYRWYEIQEKNADGTTNYYASQEKNVTKALGISSEKYWNNREMYDDLYYIGLGYDKENITDDSIKTAKHVFGYKEFSEYAGVLKTLKADKDASGNSINGSKRKKVKEYIYSLDIPDIKKHILFKSQYKNDKSHNYEIATYIGGATNMSYQQKLDVLSELGFTVDSNDFIRW